MHAGLVMECDYRNGRTQEEAFRRYRDDVDAGVPIWRVSIPGDRGSTIPVNIPARTPEEAKGKYMALCGVRSSEHEFSVVPVN